MGTTSKKENQTMRKALIAVLALFALCSSLEAQSRYIHPYRIVATSTDLPTCARNTRDRFAFALDNSQFYLCDGSTWGAIANVVSTSGGSPFAVDNLSLQTNTISSTNANGNVIVDPNGTGDVQVVSPAVLEVATINHANTLDLACTGGGCTTTVVGDNMSIGAGGETGALGGSATSVWGFYGSFGAGNTSSRLVGAPRFAGAGANGAYMEESYAEESITLSTSGLTTD